MTLTTTDAAATPARDSQTAQVEAAIDALLAAHDPKQTDNITFRGHRYDAGLAWVHFPEGFGGLGVRPDLNRLVEERLRRAGAAAQRPVDVLHRARRPDDRHPRQRRGEASGSCARCSPARRSGASCSASPVPARDFAGLGTRADPRRRRVGRQRPEGVEHARPPRATGACSSPAPIPTSRSTRG